MVEMEEGKLGSQCYNCWVIMVINSVLYGQSGFFYCILNLFLHLGNMTVSRAQHPLVGSRDILSENCLLDWIFKIVSGNIVSYITPVDKYPQAVIPAKAGHEVKL